VENEERRKGVFDGGVMDSVSSFDVNLCAPVEKKVMIFRQFILFTDRWNSDVFTTFTAIFVFGFGSCGSVSFSSPFH